MATLLRRNSISSLSDILVMFSPALTISPAVGSIRRIRQRTIVICRCPTAHDHECFPPVYLERNIPQANDVAELGSGRSLVVLRVLRLQYPFRVPPEHFPDRINPYVRLAVVTRGVRGFA